MNEKTIPGSVEDDKNRKKIQKDWHGVQLVIEYEAGDVRKGKSDFGGEWERTLTADYGYFEGAPSAEEGEDLDVLVNPASYDFDDMPETSHLITLTDDKGVQLEEKLFLGYEDEEDATNAFYQNYPGFMFGFIIAVDTEGLINEMEIRQFELRDPPADPEEMDEPTPVVIPDNPVEETSIMVKSLDGGLLEVVDPDTPTVVDVVELQDVPHEIRLELHKAIEGPQTVITQNKKWGTEVRTKFLVKGIGTGQLTSTDGKGTYEVRLDGNGTTAGSLDTSATTPQEALAKAVEMAEILARVGLWNVGIHQMTGKERKEEKITRGTAWREAAVQTLAKAWSKEARAAAQAARKAKAQGKDPKAAAAAAKEAVRGGASVASAVSTATQSGNKAGDKKGAGKDEHSPEEIAKELDHANWTGEWNSQEVYHGKDTIGYKDYDESKAEGDHLEFKKVGHDGWKVSEASSAYGFATDDHPQDHVYSTREVKQILADHAENRKYLREGEDTPSKVAETKAENAKLHAKQVEGYKKARDAAKPGSDTWKQMSYLYDLYTTSAEGAALHQKYFGKK